MSEGSWIEAIDTSRLVSVIDLSFYSAGERFDVEFIALEVRERGAVLHFRIVDAEGATGPDPTNFIIPDVALASSVGEKLRGLVIANDFVDLHSVRHRAIVTPRPQAGSRLTVSVSGLDPARSDLVWTSREVTAPDVVQS